jgi:hypothetical protein
MKTAAELRKLHPDAVKAFRIERDSDLNIWLPVSTDEIVNKIRYSGVEA